MMDSDLPPSYEEVMSQGSCYTSEGEGSATDSDYTPEVSRSGDRTSLRTARTRGDHPRDYSTSIAYPRSLFEVEKFAEAEIQKCVSALSNSAGRDVSKGQSSTRSEN